MAAAPLLAVLTADPALADMYMPPPLEQWLLPFRGGRAFLLLQPGRYRPVPRVLAMVTLYVMVCHALLWGAFKLVGSVSTFVAEEIAWLMSRRR